MATLLLPAIDGVLRTFTLSQPKGYPQKAQGAFNRVAYSAAHVVADPLSPADPWVTAAIDWDTTIAYRQRLWSLGLGVAEAMDTAQRGMGLDWRPGTIPARWSPPAAVPTIWCRRRASASTR
jgi:hypothetical protein